MRRNCKTRATQLRFVPVVVGFLLVAWLVGCSGNSNLADVRGTVTLDGKPLDKAFVIFSPESGGATSFGKTDGSGNYRMRFTDSEWGSWIGNNRVVIRTGDVLPDNTGSIPERVPSAYNTKSTLTADVKSGSNDIDFDLKSNASKVDQIRVD